MKKICIIFLIASIWASIPVEAQTWGEVMRNKDDYYWGEGFGQTLDEADAQALAMLIRGIRTHVSDLTVGKADEKTSTFRASIETYSAATLKNTEQYVLEGSPSFHVGRCIKKSEASKIFLSRLTKVKDYCQAGDEALANGKIDIALKDYYWAYALLCSTPSPNEAKYSGRPLMVWLPTQIQNVLDEVHVTPSRVSGDDIEVFFTYRNKPVNSIDFTYYDGGFESQLCSAKDGYGMLEFGPGSNQDTHRVRIEVEYRDQSRLDPELQSVISITPHGGFRAEKTIGNKPADIPTYSASNGSDPAVAPAHSIPALAATSFTDVEPANYELPAQVVQDGLYREMMTRVANAISNKAYKSCEDIFTNDGASRFHKLAKYGNAKVVTGIDDVTFTPYGKQTVARGMRLSFSFRGGIRKNFVEDVVFTFNENGLIDNVAFGLGNTVNDNILGNSSYPENVRMALAEFMENYQTAYALKDSVYIKNIFDEDAKIIIGKVIRPANSFKSENMVVLNPKTEVEYIRYNKQSFMKHLKASFDSKEYINLRFNNCRVRKAATGGEIYGIELEQDYYSNNYSDHGYLFLEINMNDTQEPKILIRTWQPEPDPNFGLYNLDYFPSNYSNHAK